MAICYDFDKTLSPDDMQTFTLIPSFGIKKQEFWDEADDLAKKNAYEDFDIVTCSSWENSFFIKKSEFNEIIDTPFEDTTAKIPTGYDAFLKRNYGDYMSPPPEEDRIAHHFYNAYKK